MAGIERIIERNRTAGPGGRRAGCHLTQRAVRYHPRHRTDVARRLCFTRSTASLEITCDPAHVYASRYSNKPPLTNASSWQSDPPSNYRQRRDRQPQGLIAARGIYNYMRSTGLSPSNLIPLFKTCRAASYSASRAWRSSGSLPMTCSTS